MADTALKFGPEWLRALSHGDGSGMGGGGAIQSSCLGSNQNNQGKAPPSDPPKYKIAEYRYGREEMLALFNKNCPLPDYMEEFTSIVTDNCQLPLALIQVTEEEQNMWARSVNSDLLQRIGPKSRDGGSLPLSGTGGSGSGGGGGGSGGVAGTNLSSLRGRGGSVDRGRGRGRGNYFQRGLSFEDGEEATSTSSAFSRTGRGGFERSQSISDRDQRWESDTRERRFERPFSGRDENGLVRKEVSRMPNDTWRRDNLGEKGKPGADDDGWHPAPTRDKWGKGSSSWRSDHREDPEKVVLRGGGTESFEASVRNGPNKAPPFRKPTAHPWDQDIENTRDHLPEWSTENGCDAEQVGSFDSTGAFMETKNALNGPIPKRRSSTSEEKTKDLPMWRRARRTCKITGELLPFGEEDSSPPMSRHDPQVSNSAGITQDRLTHSVGNPSESTQLELNTGVKSVDQLDVQPEQQPCAVRVKENPVISTTVSGVPPLVSMVPVVPSVVVPNLSPPDVVSAFSLPKTKPSEDENFDMLEKAAENMMAQWTAEEEHRVAAQQRLMFQAPQVQPQVLVGAGLDRPVVPLHHSDAYKWFYRDPQSQVQGPFTSAEMLEWSTAGYFTTSLMVRRGCDERFCQLGELIKIFGRMPFIQGPHVPPLRALSSPLTGTALSTVTSTEITPTSSTVPSSVNTEQEQQMRLMLLQQQLLHQQLLYRHQLQMQNALAQLSKQESFSSLPQQQQQQVLFKHLIAQQPIQRAPPGGMPVGLPGGLLDPLSSMPLMNMGPLPSVLKNDPSPLSWGLNSTTTPTQVLPTTAPTTGPWSELNPMPGPPPAKNSVTSGTSIWDLDVPSPPVDLEAMEEKALEEKELEKKQLEEERRQKEAEEKKRQEEELKCRREMEERERERARREQLRKEEEEIRLREAEEKERLLREAEEQKRREEAERKQREEEDQRRRAAEAEKLRRKEAELLRKQEEEQRQREEEARLRQLELEKQQKEEQEQRERQEEQQREALRLLEQEQAQRTKATTVAPWAQQAAANHSAGASNLAEIQRLQEESEKEEKLRLLHQQLQQQQQLLDLHQQQQQLQAKNHLTWASKTVEPSSVKTLIEIQQEEAEKVVKLQKQQKQQNQNTLQHTSSNQTAGSGGWGNAASQLNWTTGQNNGSQGWALNDVSNTTSISRGFWDEAASTTVQPKKVASKGGSDSAFPALDNSGQNSSHLGSSNKAKNIRSKKKEEETVMKLFETHSRPSTDEFTQWCTKALSSMQSSVDVPTFIAFLKDVESPYEVHDYVRSYLGESKEAREFAKQFLDRRSKLKNQSKQKASEENMWGPAPALTPFQNKPWSGGSNHQSTVPALSALSAGIDEGSKIKKKKKGKMQKLDGALLGFRVQADPDRINAGEIDHVDGV